MEEEGLNNNILHAVTNGWANQVYLQLWDFDMEYYCETYKIFDNMEIDEQV